MTDLDNQDQSSLQHSNSSPHISMAGFPNSPISTYLRSI